MKLSFRWFGDDDLVTLEKIRQIPNMSGIVSAIYSTPVGEVWSVEQIREMKMKIESNELNLGVIESVPVHEDIKLGNSNRDHWIEKYKQTILNLSECGVQTICYNFMPVFDWTRTTLHHNNKDGSTSLALSTEELKKLDPLDESLTLPGWDESYNKDELKDILNKYDSVSEERLWENLTYFLEAVIPVAEQARVKMAIHPDDPPYAIFGLPRIIKNKESYERLFQISNSPANGITFCTGSLGASQENNLYEMLDEYLALGRVHFMHVRNILLHQDKSFEETAHASNYGSIDMVRILSLLKKHQYTGYLRPDHGRMIFKESGRPGYGLYDRALGASYLNGIWEALS